VLLPDGKVLQLIDEVQGHQVGVHAELYDAPTGTWSKTGAPASFSYGSRMTLLQNGKVLKAGGSGPQGDFAEAEVYDPVTGKWTTTGSLNQARAFFTMTLLPNGQVLAAGGSGSMGEPLASAELYDPASGSWSLTGDLATGRVSHNASLLLDGTLLVTAGSQELQGALDSTELYDTGLDYNNAWRPQIRHVELSGGKRIRLGGSLFQGVSQASGGNVQDSSSNYPIVQLRRLDSSEVVFLQPNPARRWSDGSFASLPLSDVPPGPALVTVFTNGIPSESKCLTITQP
jgi:hypothetical protein